MKKYKWLIILLNLLILMLYFNYSVIDKENILSEGKLVLLELAPVDPRSLMQGDYMDLRYKIADSISNNSKYNFKRAYCILRIDSNNLTEFVRVQQKPTPIKNDEIPIKYSRIYTRIKIGAESFFFQEGKSKLYDSAKYGGIKIDKNGNSVLVGLYDGKQKLLR